MNDAKCSMLGLWVCPFLILDFGERANLVDAFLSKIIGERILWYYLPSSLNGI
jgi:hypothetical protein